MKFIKLNRRHHLYHKGYEWAFRFDEDWSNVWTVQRLIQMHEGRWPIIFYGKKKNGYKPFYIGVNQEKTATMVLLSLS
jgi:hypothetical protein